MTKIHDLNRLGQSIWFDYIERALLTTGGLRKLVDQGVTGVTSNPSIFAKAITGSTDYDEDMERLAARGKTAVEIYEDLALDDIAGAADQMLPVYEATDGADGFVSLEVAPEHAHDAHATFDEAVRLFTALARPNVMIKVPATPAGFEASRLLIAAGVNVNLTLIFSVPQYVRAAESFIQGVSRLLTTGPEVHGGLPAHKVASVASVFISRTDSALDPVLAVNGRPDLRGTMAVSLAKVIYGEFKRLFSGPAWEALAQKGARVQRPLWASTSTKNPDYPDTLYVDGLIGPHTVNTLPPDTLDAFLDHGSPAPALEEETALARDRVREAGILGIDLDEVLNRLQEDGLDSFARSFESLLTSISQKREVFLDTQKKSA